jgi:cell division protein FtsI/penicillin-binding protein 2
MTDTQVRATTRFAIAVFSAAFFIGNAQTRAAPEPASPCARALAQGAVCEAANTRAVELMNARKLEAATAVFDVQTGGLIAFAATPGPDPSRPDVEPLQVTTPVLPLSLTKLFLAASWWDRGLPDRSFDCARNATPDKREPMTIPDMLVTGCDLPAKQMAVALRGAARTEGILADLERFGFGPPTESDHDESFWLELAPEWRGTLSPAAAHTSLNAGSSDPDWADSLSLGETNFVVTILHISRFLQAVGNNGMQLRSLARRETTENPDKPTSTPAPGSRRIMKVKTAERLQLALRDVVQRGSAKSIAHSLDGTGWQIGGKTGTDPGPAPIGPESDGWFAGLLFDPQGQARFTVATFVRHGGRGGENAAIVSAQLAKFLLGPAKNGRSSAAPPARHGRMGPRPPRSGHSLHAPGSWPTPKRFSTRNSSSKYSSTSPLSPRNTRSPRAI